MEILLFFLILSVMPKKYSALIDLDVMKTLQKVLIHMMFECRKDFDTVFVHDGYGVINIDQLSFTKRPVSVLIFNNSMISSYESHLPATEINAFILVIHHGISLKQIIKAITSNYGIGSRWRTIAPFFIIDGHNNYCRFSLILSILHYFYKDHVIYESYYICYEAKNLTAMILTLNPYDKQAPRPWVKIALDFKPRMALFSRDFNGNICKNLYFNRMKYLEGHEIKFAVGLWNKSGFYNESFYNEDELSMLLYPPDRMYVDSLIIALKIKASFSFFDPDDLIAVYTIMSKCKFDVVLLISHEKSQRLCYESLNPTSFDTFSFVTHNKGMKTPLERIRDYYGIWTLSSMIVLFSLTFIVIWIIKRDWSFVGIEIFRLLAHSETVIEMNNLSRKIFFSMIFLYLLVFHATFSGRLIEFLTKPISYRNPETIDELADDPQYTEIISTIGPSLYLQTHPISNRVKETLNIDKCFEKVLHSKSTVCIDSRGNLQYRTELIKSQMKDSPYHIPKNGFGCIYVSVYGHKYSAIKSYIEKVYMKAVESGLFGRVLMDNYPIEALKIRTAEITGPDNTRTLTLQDLLFSFIILGVGLIFSSIIFVTEIYFNQFFIS